MLDQADEATDRPENVNLISRDHYTFENIQ